MSKSQKGHNLYANFKRQLEIGWKNTDVLSLRQRSLNKGYAAKNWTYLDEYDKY